MDMWKAGNLDGACHGFFGRNGGVSEGIFASLNCGPGSGDNLEHVRENRARVERALGAAKLLTVHQVHSANAVIVRGPWEMGTGAQADGMAANLPGLALGILTADCAPVLFADPEARVVGAAHAGWKGALGGITGSVIAAMVSLGAHRADISAAIGPAISQKNYEVGGEFREAFLNADAGNDRFFATSLKRGHFRFDLPAYLTARLAREGIGRIESLGLCTYGMERDFYSFRRATHRAETAYGRQVSAILLNN